MTLLGLAVGAPVAATGAALFQMGPAPAKAAGFVIFSTPLLLGLVGSAGLCRRIGEGLASPTDEGRQWRRVQRGGIVLALTFPMPLFGWFVVLPVTLASGLGALLAGLRARGSPPPTKPGPPQPPHATGTSPRS